MAFKTKTLMFRNTAHPRMNWNLLAVGHATLVSRGCRPKSKKAKMLSDMVLLLSKFCHQGIKSISLKLK